MFPRGFLALWLGLALLAVAGPYPALAAPPTGADAGYLGHLAEALELLKSGDCQSANDAVTAALGQRRDERLAYLVRAIVLLQDGSYAQAATAFEEAGRMGAEKDMTGYGFAISRLGQGRQADAEAALPFPGKLVSANELGFLRTYISLMCGREIDVAVGDDPRGRFLKAYASLRAGESGAAKQLLKAAVSEPVPTAALDSGVTMSLDPSAPLLRSAITPISEGKPDGPLAPAGLAGRVRLRADRTRTPGAAYVLFYVDSRLIGIVNTAPFELMWDSAAVANGVHTVRIRGEDASGVLVGETSQQVLVANSAPSPGKPLAGPGAEAVLKAAWQALQVRGSRTWAEYQLARQAEADGRKLDAMLGYERILAFQPRYRDVQQRFRALSGWRGADAVWKGQPGGGGIALTFDDGPNGGTATLLEVLKEQKVAATFFVVGSQARMHPELMRQIAADGHELACHSETHRSLTDLDEDDLVRELFGPIAAVHEITGSPPRQFRPPGGHFDARARKIASSFGLIPIMWSIHCGPYEGGEARTMEQYTASNVTSGSIVLMHNCEPTTLRALPRIVSSARARGLQPVRVSAILK